MKAAVEIITPHIAKEMLERMVMNRPLSQTTVNQYARDMQDGQWHNNGQTIIVAEDGTLLNGQHRLHAVIQSKMSISMLVARGVDKATFVTMDSGRRRALGDVLSMQGYEYASKIAAIARSAYSYASGANFAYTATGSTLEAFVHRHPYTADVAKLVGSRKLLCPHAALGAVLFLGNEKRQLNEEAQAFVDGVMTGSGLWKGDARHTLREWLIIRRDKARGPIGNLKPDETFAAVARAWNAFAAGNQINQLRMLSAPTIANLPIFGFDRHLYPDVPDIIERKTETARSNIAEVRRKRAAPAGDIVRAVV